jgi:nitroreductase
MLKAIADRCSVRSYKPDPVPESALQEIFAAAFHAPTACNLRPWHIVCVTDAAKRAHLAKVHPWAPFCEQAPVVLAFCGDRTIADHWWIEDCCAAVENAMIQAVDLGLGTCWIGIRDGDDAEGSTEQYVRDALGIPGHVGVLCLVALGYPHGPTPPQPPGPMENVHRESW